MGLFSRRAGGLVERYGARKPLVVGPIIVAVGLAFLLVPGTSSSYGTGFFPGLFVLGVSMTVSVAPLTTVVMNAAGEEQAGVASGINNAATRIVGLLAIAALGVVALSVFSSALEERPAGLEVPSTLKRAVWASRQDLAAVQVPAGTDRKERAALREAIGASFVRSFRWVIGIGAALAVLSALCAGWFIEPAPSRSSSADQRPAKPG